MSAAAPASDLDRSKRIYVYWAVGFAFLAVLGFFCWFIARPVLEVRTAAEELSGSIPHSLMSNAEQTAPLIARLGGPQEAAGKLCLFLRLPMWAWGRNENGVWAVTLLAHCGKPAVPKLSLLLNSRDPDTQDLAVHGMLIYCINSHPIPSPNGTLPIPWIETPAFAIDFTASLKAATQDKDPQVREAATKALKVWRAVSDRMPPKPY